MGKFLNLFGVDDAIKAGTAIAQTVAGISDMNKRRRFEESLALLSNQQKKELDEKLMAANTQTDRLAILSANIVQYAVANENSQSMKDTTLYIIAGCLAAVVLAGSIYYAVKTKA